MLTQIYKFLRFYIKWKHKPFSRLDVDLFIKNFIKFTNSVRSFYLKALEANAKVLYKFFWPSRCLCFQRRSPPHTPTNITSLIPFSPIFWYLLLMDGLARAGHYVLHIIYKSEQAGDRLIWIWGLKVSLYSKTFEGNITCFQIVFFEIIN